MVAILMVALIGFLALTVDFSRIYNQKNELHTATDAASLAGLLQIYQDPTFVADSAIQFGKLNKVLANSLTDGVFTVTCGTWDDDATVESARFTPSSTGCDVTKNAVRVQAFDSTNYLFPQLLSVTRKKLTITSIAWMAFVSASECIKPWGIDYTNLTKRLDPSGDPLRDLTPADITALNTLSVAELTFRLRYGDPTDPGNFGPIRIDEGDSGGDDYKNDITGCSPRLIGPGDLVYLATGGLQGPTIAGVAGENGANATRGICDQIPNGQPNHANPMVPCYYTAADGTSAFGYPLRAVLWLSTDIHGTSTPVTVKEVASFSLDSISNESEIVGHWVPYSGGGRISTSPGTIRTPILVK